MLTKAFAAAPKPQPPIRGTAIASVQGHAFLLFKKLKRLGGAPETSALKTPTLVLSK